ncbi:hypothetical protein EJD97_024900, partial [Solanum chilense]
MSSKREGICSRCRNFVNTKCSRHWKASSVTFHSRKERSCSFKNLRRRKCSLVTFHTLELMETCSSLSTTSSGRVEISSRLDMQPLDSVNFLRLGGNFSLRVPG